VIAIIHATFRGIVGSMAMTGLRVFALHAGVIREEPPSRLTRKQGSGLLRLVRRRQRRALVELVHWAMGAVFGLVFALLPERIRRKQWSGPVYGMLVWLGFDAVVAPTFGLTERGWPKGRERLVFAVDHLLFGLVLNELRSRPRE
jgi:uncharacterized membrane protein YagU involved in acid resistance